MSRSKGFDTLVRADGKIVCLAGMLSPTSNGGFNNRRVGRVSLAERGLEKMRLSGWESSHHRPSGDRGSPSRTGLDRTVKLSGRKASQSTGSVVG